MKLKSITAAILLTGFTVSSLISQPVLAGNHDGHQEQEEVEKGPNNGRMLRDGYFALELTLFERGIPPEFRIYASKNNQPVSTKEVKVTVELGRLVDPSLGDATDVINFSAQDGYLRGDMEVREPHSFTVTISAQYQGKNYQWHYDNFEGRTTISKEMANNIGIATEEAGGQTLRQSITAYGQLALAPNAIRHISARYPGLVKSLNVQLGQQVKKGQRLMTIESNDSLQTYQINAPISGTITQQEVGIGEQANEQTLLTISDLSKLVADINIYPKDNGRVSIGATAMISVPLSDEAFSPIKSTLTERLPQVNAQQANVYRAVIDNSNGQFSHGKLSIGQFVRADIVTGQFEVPLAVKTSGLQAFRDFTVVYAKVGEQYEVRMLELGRRTSEWVEVLSGLAIGTEYVTDNSYIIKADIEKAGASHDH